MKKFFKDQVPDLKFSFAVKRPIPIRCVVIDEDFEIETMEGTLKGQKGDYLMVGVEGEMYPCSKSIFDKTYHIIKVIDNEQ